MEKFEYTHFSSKVSNLAVYKTNPIGVGSKQFGKFSKPAKMKHEWLRELEAEMDEILDEGEHME